MAFDWKARRQFLFENPRYNSAEEKYGVIVIPEENSKWLASVYHLTPDENRGGCYVFIDVLDKTGARVNTSILWTWEGRRPDEPAPPIPNDKPPNEIVALAMGGGQKVDIWLPYGDAVVKVHTGHADELGPDGEIWNSWGHHSFMVIFQETHTDPVDPVDPEEPPKGIVLIDPPIVKSIGYTPEGYVSIILQVVKEETD